MAEWGWILLICHNDFLQELLFHLVYVYSICDYVLERKIILRELWEYHNQINIGLHSVDFTCQMVGKLR